MRRWRLAPHSDSVIDAQRRTATNDPSRSIALAGLVLALLLSSAQIAAHLVDYAVYGLRIDALNSNVEDSAAGWMSRFAVIVTIAVSLVFVASLRRRAVLDRLLPLLLVWVLLEMFLHTRDLLPHWQIVFAIPLGIILVSLVRVARASTAGSARTCLLIGCVLLVLSFVFRVHGEALLPALEWLDQGWPYQIRVAVKEAAEVAGWIAVAAGLAGAVLMEARLQHRDRANLVVSA